MSPIKHTFSPLRQAVKSVGSIISESVLNNSLICSRLAVHSIKSSQNWFSSCLQVFNPCWDILRENNHQPLTKEKAPHLTQFCSFQEYISQSCWSHLYHCATWLPRTAPLVPPSPAPRPTSSPLARAPAAPPLHEQAATLRGVGTNRRQLGLGKLSCKEMPAQKNK